MRAIILTIGNELLNGDIVNTNASWLSSELTVLGFSVVAQASVGDSLIELLELFSWADKKADCVIVTGGLGPTHDDITKTALQQYFSVGLKRDETVFSMVESFFKRRGIPFSESNHKQADVLENCTVLYNQWGTAPGMWIQDETTTWVVLPGVPREMKNLFTHEVTPLLKQVFSTVYCIQNEYLSVAGIGESTLSDTLLSEIPALLNDRVSLAYLPHHDDITLRITATGETKEQTQEEITRIKTSILAYAGDWIYSDSKQRMSEIVGALLRQKGWTLSVAESCTGGGLGARITETPGSSAYFNGGVITYSNELKKQLLNVPEELLNTFGAVSSQTAQAMAIGVAKLCSSDVALAITGIAGPDGGTEQKPVGTIWFGVVSPEKSFTFSVTLTKDRVLNQQRAVMIALDALRRVLSKVEPLPFFAEPHPF